MTARIPAAAKLTNREKDAMLQYANESFNSQLNDLSRRMTKLFCVSAHEEFGFGRDRLARLAERVNALTAERKDDPVFWEHVDRVLKSVGMDFPPENYTEMEG